MIWPFRREADDARPAPPRRSTRRRSSGRRGGSGSGSGRGRSPTWRGRTTGPGRASGLTFAELRAYEPGDDVRHLDWNVTARQGRPYVRRFVEERALTLWLIVDVSASLRFGPEGRTKADRAAQAAALLATAAIQNGDRVGPGPGQRPGRGRAAARRRAPPPRPAGPGPGRHARRPRGGPTWRSGLARLGRSTRRALVVVLSDFLTVEPASALADASRGGTRWSPSGWSSPARRPSPTSGLIDLEDAELGTTRTVDAGSRRVRDAYARAAEARTRDFRRWCARRGRRRARRLDGRRPDRPADPVLRRPGRSPRRAVMTPDRSRRRPEALVPPRPNLGPEPWPEARAGPASAGRRAWPWPSVLAARPGGGGRRRRSTAGRPAPGEPVRPRSASRTRRPRSRLIAASEAVRAALDRRLRAGLGGEDDRGDRRRARRSSSGSAPRRSTRLVAFLRRGRPRQVRRRRAAAAGRATGRPGPARFVGDCGGRGEVEDQREVIRADRRAEPAVDDGQVVGDEGVVDRDPVRRPGRPARLPAEPEPAVAQARVPEEVGEVRRAVGACSCRRPRSASPPSPRTRPARAASSAPERRALAAARTARRGGPARGAGCCPAKSNVAWSNGLPPGTSGSAGRRPRSAARGTRGPGPGLVVAGVLDAVGILRADRLEAGQPGVGDLDQADDVGPLAADQADRGRRDRGCRPARWPSGRGAASGEPGSGGTGFGPAVADQVGPPARAASSAEADREPAGGPGPSTAAASRLDGQRGLAEVA